MYEDFEQYLLKFLGQERYFPVSDDALIAILPGADLHLDARIDASLTYDGSNNVSAWADQSGNGYNLTTFTAPTAYPIRVPNAFGSTRTVVNCPDTTIRSMNNGVMTAASTGLLTVYAVCSMETTSAFYKRLVSLYTAANSEVNNVARTAAILKHAATSNEYSSRRNSADLSRFSSNSSPHVVCSRYDGVNHQTFVDGVGATAVASTGAFNYTTCRLFQTNVSPTTNTQWVGSLGMLLLYRDESHSDSDVLRMSTFLKSDWGI